jgi:hypothetical protein
MTVAVLVKVFDGIVLGADSATTLQLSNGSAQVYNNANKVFHLHRELPIGAMTWGLGSIGSASISTLAKDLRRRLMGLDPLFPAWKVDSDKYTIKEIAHQCVEMLQGELYSKFLSEYPDLGFLGFLVAGYGSDGVQAEAWNISIDGSATPVPVLAADADSSGWVAYAQPEATERLFRGIDPGLRSHLIDNAEGSFLKEELAQVFASVERLAVVPPMPIVDAINFAKFLVDTTVGYSNFLLGPNTVGGPVELAAITRHEGFKWIARKHYYDGKLNP